MVEVYTGRGIHGGSVQPRPSHWQHAVSLQVKSQERSHTETHAHTHTHIHIHTHVHIPTHTLWYTFLHLKVWESKRSAQMEWNPSCVLTWMIWFLIISCVVLLATCALASPRPDDGYGGFPFSRLWYLSLFSNYVVHHYLLFITSPNYDD